MFGYILLDNDEKEFHDPDVRYFFNRLSDILSSKSCKIVDGDPEIKEFANDSYRIFVNNAHEIYEHIWALQDRVKKLESK